MSQPPNPDPPSPGGNFPFSPEDALQFMQRMWNPFGVPMPGFGLPGAGAASGAAGPAAGTAFPNPATMFATLDPAEIERKIGELKVIENWLQMSLNLMQMSIKTMELQKASLEVMRSSHSPAPQGGTAGRPPGDQRSKK
ncbi:MAG: PhaM family polyhydroxyalkanoate granule multifunctional regulatory protein [Casimicrobiaceae bacterium]